MSGGQHNIILFISFLDTLFQNNPFPFVGFFLKIFCESHGWLSSSFVRRLYYKIYKENKTNNRQGKKMTFDTWMQ